MIQLPTAFCSVLDRFSIKVKPITNVTALKYFQYWQIIPKAEKTEQQREKKFDFYKYVVGADLSLKYRGKEWMWEVEE